MYGKKLSAFCLRTLLLCLLLAVLGLAACGKAGEGEEEAYAYVTITDDLGREVLVPVRPQRVAALTGSLADIWCLAGGEQSITAVAGDAWTSFDLNLPAKTVDLGSVEDVELETLIAAEPDLVLAASNMVNDTKYLESFEELGYPVLFFQADTFAQYLHLLDICTQLTGQEENFQKYGTQLQAQVDEALSRVREPAPSVLFLRASASSCKARGSQGTVLGEMLADLGCRNIADSNDSILEDLSIEAIIAEDPEYIFVVYYGSRQSDAEALLQELLLSHPAWEGLTAIREGRYYVLDKSLYHLKPNARWGEAYENLAEILYGGGQGD